MNLQEHHDADRIPGPKTFLPWVALHHRQVCPTDILNTTDLSFSQCDGNRVRLDSMQS